MQFHDMRKIRCPRCGQITEYSPSNSYRPFCSERCKIIDLGDWADERYKIPIRDLENDFSADEETTSPPPPKPPED